MQPAAAFTRPPDAPELARARERFARDGVARLACPFEPQAWEALCAEIVGLRPLACRKEFRNAHSDNTLRRMSTIGQAAIVASGARLIGELYRDPGLLAVLRAVAGGELYLASDPEEEYAINWLHREGDVQGAHRDTYAYGVILVIEAPPPGCGGRLEVWDAAGAGEEPTVRIEVAAGDCLILRSDRHRHRVSPLQCPDASRLVLGLGYADSPVAPREIAPSGPLYAPGDYVAALDDPA